MTQMLHSFRPSLRLSDSRSFGKAVVASCNTTIKGGEWYEVPGAGGEVGPRRR